MGKKVSVAVKRQKKMRENEVVRVKVYFGVRVRKKVIRVRARVRVWAKAT